MDTMEYGKVIAVWLAAALLSLMVFTACGSVLEVSVETTPTTDAAATATPSALATETPRPATQVATLAVPTPTPTPSLGKLAYVQGGDIWVKALRRGSGQALPEGDPQRLTTDGRNSQPRWSPSGEWLAFRKDAQVWLVRADGNDLHPLWEGGPVSTFAWSPTEDRLACVAGSGILRLEAINADGTDPATLIPLPICALGQLGRIAWSPDGAWIAYEWLEQRPAQYLTYQGLWKVSSDGGQRAELYASGAPEKGVALLAGWSLDGQHILFWQGDILSASLLSDGVALYSLPAGGGEPIQLVDSVLVHDDFVAPAPRGDWLAVTAGYYRATWTNKRVAVVEADGGELTWLTDESAAAFSPAWAPDGVHLAYAAMPDQGDLVGGEDARLGMMERRIWVVNTQGKPQPQQLTDDPAYRDEHPLWSADGSHLLFARMEAEGPASLWLISAGGGDPRRVVDELTPLPGPASGWFGYYGHVDWDQLFDWWPGPGKGA
jgi:Tol biopolymer transport system component